MEPDIEHHMLKYIIIYGYSLLEHIPVDDLNYLFSTTEHKHVAKAACSYYERYGETDDHKVVYRYIIDEVKEKVNKETIVDLLSVVEHTVLDNNINYIRQLVEGTVKKKKLVSLLQNSLKHTISTTNNASLQAGYYDSLADKILSITHTSQEDNENARFLIADANREYIKAKSGVPTFLNSMNQCMTAGGFATPEIVVLVGAPKSFKTGFMLNLAINYMLQHNFNVLYADCENGEEAIDTRMRQCILKRGYNYVRSAEGRKEYTRVVSTLKQTAGLKGDVHIKRYRNSVSTLREVESDIEKLKKERGFNIDLVIYDYLDLFSIPGGTYNRAYREVSQYNYKYASGINQKYGCFCITASQVNRKAAESKTAAMTDVAEDFGKTMHCHSMFGLVDRARRDDGNQGMIEVRSLAQRNGRAGIHFNVEVDFDTMVMKEPTTDEEVVSKPHAVMSGEDDDYDKIEDTEDEPPF